MLLHMSSLSCHHALTHAPHTSSAFEHLRPGVNSEATAACHDQVSTEGFDPLPRRPIHHQTYTPPSRDLGDFGVARFASLRINLNVARRLRASCLYSSASLVLKRTIPAANPPRPPFCACPFIDPTEASESESGKAILGPTHPQHPFSRGTCTLTPVAGSTGPALLLQDTFCQSPAERTTGGQNRTPLEIIVSELNRNSV